MQTTIDINADMGEGTDIAALDRDARLLDIISSANIACGFHAGSPDTMGKTMARALAKGVGLGAHPGFDDKAGFGRQRMQLPNEELRHLISFQVAAAQGMAKAAGGQLRHVKLHGALANMAAEDLTLARTCFEAVQALDPDLKLVVIAATAQHQAAEEMGLPYACEIFADRAYNDDATLVDRSQTGAVIHDPQKAAESVAAMVEAGGVISQSGKIIPTRIDTVCVHGDTAEAFEIARAVREALEGISAKIRPL